MISFPQSVKRSVMIAPRTVAITSSTTVTANLDTLGASYAVIHLVFGIEANTSAIGPTISLLSSDDTVVSNFATVAADVGGSADFLATAGKFVTYGVDLRGRKRYLRLAVSTGTNSTNDGIFFAAIGELYFQHQQNSSTSNMGDVVTLVG